MCELQTRWDQRQPEAMLKKWNKWKNNLPEKMVAPRAFRFQHEKIEAIQSISQLVYFANSKLKVFKLQRSNIIKNYFII